MPHIECCLGNVDTETCDRLRSRSDVRVASCLDRCGQCHAAPFLVVDGRVRTGVSHEALLDAWGEE